MNIDSVMSSIHRLANSYGYTIPKVTGSVSRLKGRAQAWRLVKLLRADGTPGPEVTVRVVDGRLRWERQS